MLKNFDKECDAAERKRLRFKLLGSTTFLITQIPFDLSKTFSCLAMINPTFISKYRSFHLFQKLYYLYIVYTNKCHNNHICFYCKIVLLPFAGECG